MSDRLFVAPPWPPVPVPNRFDVYLHVDITNNADPRLGEILAAVQRIETGVKNMANTLDDLINLVTAETTALGSVRTLITELHDLVIGYMGGTLTPENQAKVDAAFAAAMTNAQAITDALAAGVINPPAGEPPPAAAKKK